MASRVLTFALVALLVGATPDVAWAAGPEASARAAKRPGRWKALGKKLMTGLLVTTLVAPSLSGCVGPFDAKAPAHPTNACSVMQEKGIDWYKDLKAAEKKWGMPKEQILAIAYRESTLDADARGEASFKLAWPMIRRAKGMAQVMPSTLDRYNQAMGNDWFSANPDKPATAFDIIGWHGKTTTQEIRRPDLITNPKVVAQMHHGGSGAYGTPQYLDYAKDVAKMTAKYKADFAQCGAQLDQQARPLLQKLTDGLKNAF